MFHYKSMLLTLLKNFQENSLLKGLNHRVGMNGLKKVYSWLKIMVIMALYLKMYLNQYNNRLTLLHNIK